MDFKHLQRQKTYFMVIISTVNTEHTWFNYPYISISKLNIYNCGLW